MNLPEEAPKLPLAPFLVGDAALVATAVFIGKYCAAPIGPWHLLAIAFCVLGGAVLSALPFVVNYAKRQDAELTERQNQIAALARTTAESAEQISIAAAGLHGISEASSANLKLIEQFPAQLQEHINGLQKQLVAPPKSAPAPDESPRLDAAATRITEAVSDLAKLEAATRQHIASVNETLAQFPARAEKASAKAGEQLAAAATAAVLEAKTHAFADFELHLTAAVTRALASVETALVEAPRRKRASKPAVETPPATEETLSNEPPPPPAEPEPTATASPVSEPAPAAEPAIESPPAPPVATEETLSTSVPADPSPEEVPVAEPPKPRARQPKLAPADSGFDLGLSVETSETERSISSDGVTRLVATAYIGIGNKLFIRGEGPGLSWDKGIPLQFVSIGKWRWETDDATAPIRAKLYKNDQTECTSVGTITLEPGHQHDVNAGF